MTRQLSCRKASRRRASGGIPTLFAALLVAIPVAAFLGASPSVASSSSAASSIALRVLVIGAGASDPTTAAWEAALSNEGVAYTEVDAGTTLGVGNWTVALPSLTSPGSSSEGLFDGVVLADEPTDLATGQLSPLFFYESAFDVRQIDGYIFPGPAVGLTEVSSGSLNATGATLTAAGLSTFPALKGPVPFDTGTWGYPATVTTGLPAGASETPLLEADQGTVVGGVSVSGDVLMGIYQHAISTTDPQSGVAELTIGFDYDASQLQWLILAPELIDWVTGGEHLGLFRNYIGQDVDDIFIADNVWSNQYQCTPGATDPSDFTCPPGVANNSADTPSDIQMSAADVNYVVNWEVQNNFKLNLAFNGSGACTAPSAASESKANCTGAATINGTTYTDPGQDVSDSAAPNSSAFVNALLADQASFNWITHTWSHQFLGCVTWQPMKINTPVAASSGGSLSAGTYYYEVTAATAYGESEPSLVSSAAVGASGSVELTWPDATNGGGPSLATLESEFSGGTGFWGYYVYRSTSGSGPFGLVGQVAEHPIGSEASYSFTDTGTGTLGGSPSSTSTFPTATNPGIECAPGGWYAASSTSPDSSIDQEIGLDVAFAEANGLTNFTPSAVVTGEHSGLESPEMPTALADMGITTFAADASRQLNPYTIAGTSTAGSVTAYSAPRYPTNIYYNAPTWDDEVNEYNTLYVAAGDSIGGGETGRCVDTSSSTCLTSPADETSILASESRIELGHVLDNNPRVSFAHQSNLVGPDYTLLSLLSDVLGQYSSWYSSNTPFIQTTDATSSQILSEQAAWADAGNTVSAVTSNGIETITNNGTSPLAVPITAPLGSTTAPATAFGSTYGDTLSAWETLAPGASITIDVPMIAQAITFTSAVPTNAAVGGSYDVTATGGASGEPVSFSVDSSSDGACSISGATVSFLELGTCVIDANQAGNLSYAAAPTATQSFAIAGIAQAITFTSAVPTNAAVGGSYAVTATGGASGEPVSFSVGASSNGACSISGATVSFLEIGTCAIDANQAGNPQYVAAETATQGFAIAGIAQAITFTSSAPTHAVVGGSYGVTATGGTSGEPVSFSVDASSDGACSISGATVSFLKLGSCVIDANQVGNAQYLAAPAVTQSFAVAKSATVVAATKVSVSLSPVSVTYGRESATVFATTLTAPVGVAVPKGEKVTVQVGSAKCTVVLSAGKGTCRIANSALRVGSYSVSAVYGGDAKLGGSKASSPIKFTVKSDRTTSKVSISPNSVSYGDEAASVFTASIATRYGEAVPNGEKVTVHIGSAKCTAVLKRGRHTCKIANSALPVGSYSVSVTYGGDANLIGSRGLSKSKLTVNGPSSS